MITHQASRGQAPGSVAAGLSALWIIALLLAAIVLAAIATAKTGALPTTTAKALLSVTITLFFVVSFAAMRMDADVRRKVPSHPLRVEDDVARDDDDAPPAPEPDQVYSWRSTRLMRLGVDRELRTILAAEPAFSIHELERLLAAGCPLGTALRILQPD